MMVHDQKACGSHKGVIQHTAKERLRIGHEEPGGGGGGDNISKYEGGEDSPELGQQTADRSQQTRREEGQPELGQRVQHPLGGEEAGEDIMLTHGPEAGSTSSLVASTLALGVLQPTVSRQIENEFVSNQDHCRPAHFRK
jgi:hypothetical protein